MKNLYKFTHWKQTRNTFNVYLIETEKKEINYCLEK